MLFSKTTTVKHFRCVQIIPWFWTHMVLHTSFIKVDNLASMDYTSRMGGGKWAAKCLWRCQWAKKKETKKSQIVSSPSVILRDKLPRGPFLFGDNHRAQSLVFLHLCGSKAHWDIQRWLGTHTKSGLHVLQQQREWVLLMLPADGKSVCGAVVWKGWEKNNIRNETVMV